MLWLLHLSAAARTQISHAWPVTLHLQVDRPLLLLLLCCLRHWMLYCLLVLLVHQGKQQLGLQSCKSTPATTHNRDRCINRQGRLALALLCCRCWCKLCPYIRQVILTDAVAAESTNQCWCAIPEQQPRLRLTQEMQLELLFGYNDDYAVEGI
jgi:hypothetical protein